MGDYFRFFVTIKTIKNPFRHLNTNQSISLMIELSRAPLKKKNENLEKASDDLYKYSW